MNKKVLLINGSARKKNTYNILTQIGQILDSRKFDFEIINLFDYKIEDCVGCEICVGKKECYKNDDMKGLMEKILNSDGVVLASPVYMNGVTSKFKTFADRLNAWVHKPEAAGKPVMFVSVTASSGLPEVHRFFVSFAAALGVRRGDYVSRTNQNINKAVGETELTRFIALLDRDKRLYRPAMNEIIMFVVGKVLALKSQAEDRKYWEEKNWFDKNYYYPCKINPVKKLLSKFLFKVISKAMK